MSREIRKVPAGWEHPRYGEDEPVARLRGRHRPQFEQTRTERAAADPEAGQGDDAWYRPPELAGGDQVQLYECTTEGTPLSPVFSTREELIEHLAAHGDSEGRAWNQEAISRLRESGYLSTGEAVALGV